MRMTLKCRRKCSLTAKQPYLKIRFQLSGWHTVTKKKRAGPQISYLIPIQLIKPCIRKMIRDSWDIERHAHKDMVYLKSTILPDPVDQCWAQLSGNHLTVVVCLMVSTVVTHLKILRKTHSYWRQRLAWKIEWVVRFLPVHFQKHFITFSIWGDQRKLVELTHSMWLLKTKGLLNSVRVYQIGLVFFLSCHSLVSSFYKCFKKV